jgi:hypothetical protein
VVVGGAAGHYVSCKVPAFGAIEHVVHFDEGGRTTLPGGRCHFFTVLWPYISFAGVCTACCRRRGEEGRGGWSESSAGGGDDGGGTVTAATLISERGSGIEITAQTTVDELKLSISEALGIPFVEQRLQLQLADGDWGVEGPDSQYLWEAGVRQGMRVLVVAVAPTSESSFTVLEGAASAGEAAEVPVEWAPRLVAGLTKQFPSVESAAILRALALHDGHFGQARRHLRRHLQDPATHKYGRATNATKDHSTRWDHALLGMSLALWAVFFIVCMLAPACWRSWIAVVSLYQCLLVIGCCEHAWTYIRLQNRAWAAGGDETSLRALPKGMQNRLACVQLSISTAIWGLLISLAIFGNDFCSSDGGSCGEGSCICSEGSCITRAEYAAGTWHPFSHDRNSVPNDNSPPPLYTHPHTHPPIPLYSHAAPGS